MPEKEFEKFIKQLLDKADEAERLREIQSASPGSSKSLLSTIDRILQESSVGTEFDHNGYSNEDTKIRVLKKLVNLHKLLTESPDPLNIKLFPAQQDIYTVLVCIKKVSDGYALTPEIVKQLNEIYSKYNYYGK